MNIDDGRRLNDDEHARWWLWPPACEHHFRAICDGIPSLISLATPAGEIQIANRHFLQYSGTTAEELHGRASVANIHPDDLPGVIAAWTESTRTCQSFSIEARRRRVDGAYRWFETHGFPLLDAQGRIASWYVLDRDVEDQKRAEALLAGERRFLEMVARGCPMPAILDALCKLVESTVDGCRSSVLLLDPTGTPVEFATGPGIPPSFVASLNAAYVGVTTGPCAMAAHLNEQVIVTDIASEMRWKASGWCELVLAYDVRACWSTPVTSSEGKVLGVFAVYYDQPRIPTSQDLSVIDQLKHFASIAIERTLNDATLGRVRSELAQMSRITALGAMTASIAHEVNQPLTSIIANATTSMRHLATDPPNLLKAREAIQRTIHDGNRAADVVSGLRALFRKQPASSEPVDVNAALEEVVALSLGELHDSRVIVCLELAEDLPPVCGDRVQLQQVIFNLLVNAAEAMAGILDRPRTVTIRTAPEQDARVRLSVQDTGVGFDAATAARLFDAFYTTKSGGTGIGLSVSRSIIEGHGGQLWATANEGPGATFSFTVPLQQSPQVTAAPGLDREPLQMGLAH